MNNSEFVQAPLGQDVAYPVAYNPALLFPIDRTANRQHLLIPDAWHGDDIWNAYELSWLNLRGKPVVALGRFVFPQTNPRLIESKSFKLYLNSFNEERHQDTETVRRTMQHDLEAASGGPVGVSLRLLDALPGPQCQPLDGSSIDDADIDINVYEPAAGLLRCLPEAPWVSETLRSDLLKSNCPVTGQPDWGSVQVSYTGPQIDQHALLRYIVSLRRHTEFHEHCVEKMYCDIWQACQPDSLFVYARYTRRGGLDINPWRSSKPAKVQDQRTVRQ